MFDLDKPIEKISQDKLNLLPFANGMARSIANQRIGDGFVIAINGAWGSGKTSAVNLALLALKRIEKEEQKKEGNKTTIIFKFEPWLHTGQQGMIVEFFAGLAECLDKTMGYEVAKAVRNISSGLLQRSSSLFSVAAIGADAAGGGGAATTTLAIGKELSRKIPASWGRDSLSKHRERLKDLLRRQGRRVVVLVDDVDRLQTEEMRLMLGVLKSIADLPGVIYLLPMNVRLVAEAIKTERDIEDEAGYLEKIVQVTLEMPSPNTSDMYAYFADGLSSVLEDREEDRYDISDWDYISSKVVPTYLKTPRSAIRLLNRLRVSWPVVRGETYFPDLLGVEALREFEPSLYSYIRDNGKSIIAISGSEKKSFDKMTDTLTQRMKQETKDGALSLCRLLFPSLAYRSRSTLQNNPLSGRRVSEEDGFEAYFRWSLPSDVATIKELRDIQASLARKESVSVAIESIAKRIGPEGNRASSKLLDAIIDSRLADQDGVLLMEALLRNAELIVDVPPDVDWMASASSKLSNALEILVGSINAERRPKAISAVMDESTLSLYAGARLMRAVMPSAGDDESFMTEKEIKEICSRWLENQVKKRVSDLRNDRRASAVVAVIEDCLGADFAEPLVSDNLNSQTFAASVALGLMSRVNSSNKSRIYRDLTSMPNTKVYDISALVDAIAGIDTSQYSELDRDGLITFRSKAKLILEGKFIPKW